MVIPSSRAQAFLIHILLCVRSTLPRTCPSSPIPLQWQIRWVQHQPWGQHQDIFAEKEFYLNCTLTQTTNLSNFCEKRKTEISVKLRICTGNEHIWCLLADTYRICFLTCPKEKSVLSLWNRELGIWILSPYVFHVLNRVSCSNWLIQQSVVEWTKTGDFSDPFPEKMMAERDGNCQCSCRGHYNTLFILFM